MGTHFGYESSCFEASHCYLVAYVVIDPKGYTFLEHKSIMILNEHRERLREYTVQAHL